MPLPYRDASWRLSERLREAKRIGEAVEEGTPKQEVARELGKSRTTIWRREAETKGVRFGHQSKRLSPDASE